MKFRVAAVHDKGQFVLLLVQIPRQNETIDITKEIEQGMKNMQGVDQDAFKVAVQGIKPMLQMFSMQEGPPLEQYWVPMDREDYQAKCVNIGSLVEIHITIPVKK
jgi:hypothetical protein